jgi:hypothetical protein
VDEATQHRYTIGQAIPLPGAEALPALILQDHIDSAHTLERGSLKIVTEDDPSYGVLPW